MPFDIATAKPITKTKFDISTARSISQLSTPTVDTPEQKTERLISGRKDLLKEVVSSDWGIDRKKIDTPLKFAIHTIRGFINPTENLFARKGMQLAGVPSQRMEAATANILEKPKTSFMGAIIPPVGIWENRQAIMEGLLGKRIGELGDIGRRAGWPEWVSSGLGLLASFGIANLASEGKLVNVPKKVIGTKFEGIVDKIVSPIKQYVSIEDDIAKVINQGITKGIRPSVSGKKTLAGVAKYDMNAVEGVKNIIKNKAILGFTDDLGNAVERVPESLADYAQATQVMIKKFYEEYTDKAISSGDKGAMFDARNTINRAVKIAQDKGLPPDVREATMKFAQDLSELHGESPMIIQDRIKAINEGLKSFYSGGANPVNARVRADIVKVMRQDLDELITKNVGSGYQELKNKWGGLKSLEKDINHRYVVVSRQAPRSLVDTMGDAFSAGEVLSGLATGNVGNVVKGASIKIIKDLHKRINSPDNIIKNMFKNVDDLMSKQSKLSGKIPRSTIAEVVNEVNLKGNGQKLLTKSNQPYGLLPNKQRQLPSAGIQTTAGEYPGLMRNPRFADYIRTKRPIPPGTPGPQAERMLIERWEEFKKL